MPPLSTKVEFCRLYPNGKNYHFIGVSAPFGTFWYTKVVKTRSLALLFPCAPVLQVVKHVVKGEKWACSTLKEGKNKPIDYVMKTRDLKRFNENTKFYAGISF